jgi:hypothetical protein
MKYIAQIRARNGRLLFQTGAHDSREAAAEAAFSEGPTSAQSCSTSEACHDPSGAWRSTGIDIRWHRRDEFGQEPGQPSAIGLMAPWPKGAKAVIGKGWGYWVGQDFRRAQDDLRGTIDIEVPGYVFMNLHDGRRVKTDKRSVQIMEDGHAAT